MGNSRIWAKGLLAAIVGGASNAFTAAFVDPDHFDPFRAGWAHCKEIILVGAIIAAFHYLAQSPLPPDSKPKARMRRARQQALAGE